MKDIAIVGAGPAGYSAAITARKRNKSVVVIGQNTGWLAHAHSIANYPGLPDISGHDLLEAMKKQAQDLGRGASPRRRTSDCLAGQLVRPFARREFYRG